MFNIKLPNRCEIGQLVTAATACAAAKAGKAASYYFPVNRDILELSAVNGFKFFVV